MKKTFLLFITATAAFCFFCCKKEKANPQDILVGTWTLSEVGVDYNKNKKVDAGETVPVSSTNVSGTLTFRQDGSYTFQHDGGAGETIETGTYFYSTDKINLITPTDSTYLPITSLSEHGFTVDIADAWSVYTKS